MESLLHQNLSRTEVRKMIADSSKPNKLRNVYVTILNWKVYYIKIKVIAFIINFRRIKKMFSKFMIPIALLQTFGSLNIYFGIISGVEVCNMIADSSKPNKLRNVYRMGSTTRNVTIQKRTFYYIKIKGIALILNFRGNKSICYRKM